MGWGKEGLKSYPPQTRQATAPPPQPHSCEGLKTPSVWRGARNQAVAKVEASTSSGMDEIEIPAFLRKQAD